MRANLLAAIAAVLPLVAICAVSVAHAAPSGATARASVVGGKEATQGTYPWMAFIVDAEGGEVISCSGTVIAPRVVLTAAHCVLNEESGSLRDPSGYQVVTGVVDWTSPERQVSAVTQLAPYPKFADGTSRNFFGDVALLGLATPTTAPSIPLAKGTRFLRMGTRARIAGWGMTSARQKGFTESLRWAKTVVQGSPCEGYWGRICAVDFPSFAAGVCFGDSGGPLVAFDRKRGWVEFGVAQAVFNNCTTRRPQLYTRTDLLAKWIAGRIAKIEAG